MFKVSAFISSDISYQTELNIKALTYKKVQRLQLDQFQLSILC